MFCGQRALKMAGDEACADLEANQEFREKLESIRLEAGLLMGLGDVTDTTIPKMTLVSRARSGGDIWHAGRSSRIGVMRPSGYLGQ